MILITKPNATEPQIEHIIERIAQWGLRCEVSRGEFRVVIGVIGPEDQIREKPLGALPGVESVTPVLKPYKLVSYEFRGMHSPVAIGGVSVGEPEVVVMSGPCSVESREQIVSIAQDVKAVGARVLRGGAFKPRTSPYSFQGLGVEGLKLLAEAREITGLPVITEIMDTKDIEAVEQYADCLQIGARNMQNFALFKEVGRNTLDLNAIPVLKAETHLPVVVDPTHGIGLREHVGAMAAAAVAAGADGLMVEVHNSPELAKSDGEQALLPDEFALLMNRVRAVAEAVGRSL